MNLKGHLGFGSICLYPVYKGLTINYIITNDKFLNLLNDKIYNINQNIINWQYILIQNSFDIKNWLNIIFTLFIYYLGIRFPDIDLLLKKFLNKKTAKLRYLYHRQITHSFFLTIIGLFYFSNNLYLVIFFYGILTHLIADMLTGSVPLFLTGKYYKTLSLFSLRIGIDDFYIFLKPNYQKGKTKLQKIIEDIKEKIVLIFDKISNYLILIMFVYFIFLKYY